MLLCLLFLFSVTLTSALPTTPKPIGACNGDQTPYVTASSPWTLPYSSFEDNQRCTYWVSFPDGNFAYMEITVDDLQPDEDVSIEDTQGSTVKKDRKANSFSNTGAWGTDFFIEFNTAVHTRAQFSINISVFPATPKANIVKSYITYAGAPSVFLDTDSWNEGESYKFKSKTDKIYIIAVNTPNATEDYKKAWNNVFIYEDGMYITRVGSMTCYISLHEVTLYMAKKVDIPGAIMITDYADVAHTNDQQLYLTKNTGSLPFIMNASKAKASLTLVSSRKNPVKVDVKSLHKSSSVGVFSYNKGGPLNSTSNLVQIGGNQLPLSVGGYANTFYLSNGDGMIGFDFT